MKALFAGSFDPFTIGHASIVERALPIFDEIIIGVGYNERKPGEWTPLERVEAIAAYYCDVPLVSVAAYTGLTAEYAKEAGADVLLRAVRTVQDFEYERNLAEANRAVFGIDTVILYSDPQYAFVSSSLVRELIHNGFDAKKFIAGDFPKPQPKR